MKLEETEFGSGHRALPPGIPGPPPPPRGSALRSAFSPRLDLAFRGRSARDQGLIFIMRLLRVREAAWQGRQSLGLAGKLETTAGPWAHHLLRWPPVKYRVEFSHCCWDNLLKNSTTLFPAPSTPPHPTPWPHSGPREGRWEDSRGEKEVFWAFGFQKNLGAFL